MARRKRNPPMGTGFKIAIALGVGVGIFLITRKVFGATTMGDLTVVPAIDPAWLKKAGVNQRKLNNAAIVEDEFKKSGMPDNLIAAALVNAWTESGWNESAIGDSGHSVGLFQLHDKGGGHGLSMEFRKDPRNNARTILDREVLAKMGTELRQRASEGANVGELAAIFSRDIERPRDKEGNMASRKALAARMFPTMA